MTKKNKYFSPILLMGLSMIMGCENQKKDSNTTENTVSNEDNNSNPQAKQDTRIVSLNGTISEVLSEIGLSEKIVATDITSNYPNSVAKLPKVGHNKNISTEGILSQNPTHVYSIAGESNDEVLSKIKSTGVEISTFSFDYSLDGMISITKDLSNRFDITYNSDSLKTSIQSQLDSVKPFDTKPKVLFIYARGIGSLNVGGKGTKIQKMINLAGAENVSLDFEGYKPLTAESLIKANPDVILMFASGYESLDGGKQLLEVPGVAETNAGMNNAFITMDGSFLSSFSPRLGFAVQELNQKIHKAIIVE